MALTTSMVSVMLKEPPLLKVQEMVNQLYIWNTNVGNIADVEGTANSSTNIELNGEVELTGGF